LSAVAEIGSKTHLVLHFINAQEFPPRSRPEFFVLSFARGIDEKTIRSKAKSSSAGVTRNNERAGDDRAIDNSKRVVMQPAIKPGPKR
jgi:hypothetical protein